MADRYQLAFVKNAVGATGTDPQEQTALANLLFQRLITAGLAVSSSGVISTTVPIGGTGMPWINVKDYGAVGDGVTNDTVAITAATVAAGSTSFVLFPAGTYLTTLQTWTAGLRTRWVGAGRGLTTLKSTGGSGAIVSATWSHLAAEWYSELSGMTLDGNGGTGPILSWTSGTLVTLRDVVLTNVTGTGLNLSTLYDSHIENVYVETCGDSTHPCVTLNSLTADALNNCQFVNLHVEPGNRDAILLDLIGTGTGLINANVFYGLKVHGDSATGNPNRPVLRLSAQASSNIFFGGIVAFGRSTSQVEVTGNYNTFYSQTFGIGVTVPATAYDLIGGRNRVLAPTFQSTTYSTAMIRNSGGIENVVWAPEYSGGTLISSTGGQYRIEYRDVATALWTVTDSQGQAAVDAVSYKANGDAGTSGKVLIGGATAAWTASPSLSVVSSTQNLVASAIGNLLNLNHSGADAGVTNDSYIIFATNGAARWYLGMSAATVSGNFELYDGIDGYLVLSSAKGSGDISLPKGLAVTGGIVDPTDVTKQLLLSLSGMTTAKTLTLASAQTTTQTLTIPVIRQAETLAIRPQTYTTLSTPLNPAGTSNTSGLMMGLAGAITPQVTGKIRVTICGQLSNTATNGAKVQIRVGTGTAPVNGAALTGTVYGSQQSITAIVGALSVPFCLSALVTGLAVGTACWLDVDVAAIVGGTATIAGVAIDAFEV